MKVTDKAPLNRSTLHLTVFIIDKYLSSTEVTIRELQLVGLGALWIASKYEDIYPPQMHELTYICNHDFSEHDIKVVEA
jgi:hypothetical protein